MIQDILRSTIRNILLETRANLPIRPLMKIWWDVASKYGEPDAPGFVRTAVWDFNSQDTYGKHASLRVPQQHKHKVFDAMTPEVQEWVIRHWKTREYFGNMIAGVTLSIVELYPGSPTAIGRKSGDTSIKEGTWDNEDKTWIGGMSGYLSMKNKKRNTWWFKNFFQAKQKPTEKFNSAEIDRKLWNEEGQQDLMQGDSVLVHEFQHWFQESVMYTDKRLMTPTKGTPKGKYRKPKDRREQLIPVPSILKLILDQIVDGIDYQNPKQHPLVKLPMYEITDHQVMMDSIFANAGSEFSTIWPLNTYGQRQLPVAWLEQFVAETMKIPLTPKGKESLKEKRPFSKIHDQMWGLDTASGQENNAIFDTSNFKSGRVKQIRKVVQKADSGVAIYLVPKSHIVKNTLATTKDLKPNKFPIRGTEGQLEKEPAYIIFAKDKDWTESRRDRFNKDKGGRGTHTFEKLKNPIMGWDKKWNERWVEFDAESRNYLSWVVQQYLRGEPSVHRFALSGNDAGLADFLYKKLRAKLEYNDRIDRRILEKNDKELRTLAERVSDRIIEITELYDPDWYRDDSNRPSQYDPITNNVTDTVISQFIKGERSLYTAYWGEYWYFIHDKVTGEI